MSYTLCVKELQIHEATTEEEQEEINVIIPKPLEESESEITALQESVGKDYTWVNEVRITLPTEYELSHISIYTKFLEKMLTTPRIRELSYIMSFVPHSVDNAYARKIFNGNLMPNSVS
ncbi:hypothetical protein L1987_14932 [Smallanthus sonchifolius]|uniref:Uncharacterized protein n=1 Tax=Smallanthus sonchifolius TaxID=185202 RepID=A0ACB9J6Q9_9ASTR|nr:hypothetical protein L1987_14932 [Smallanthus sonchifolius]